MKKNAMLKIAAILLVAVLLTTCAISSTFAKYVTKGAAKEVQARVAKFGVTATLKVTSDDAGTTDTDLFLDDYGTETIYATATDSKAIFAPGTAHKVWLKTTAVADATNEVSYEVNYDAVVEINGFVINTTEYYCPVVFNVNGTEIEGMDYTSAADFADAVEEAIEDLDDTTATYISWTWAFEVGADDDAKAANNEKDTKLAATTSTIKVSVAPVVSQTGPAATLS